jgi:multiple antibiotic resistance protein
MMLPITDYTNAFVILLAIVDPIGAVPIFIGMSAGKSSAVARRMAYVSAVTVGAVLVGAALFGETLLKFFGISMASFRVAGGLLLLLVGISMLHARKGTGLEDPAAKTRTTNDEMAVVPLAIPLLSGPGAISTMTIYAHRSAAWQHTAILIFISLLLALITWLLLRLAQPIGRYLGKIGMNIAVRLMGLLLSAAAVQFISEGLAQLFPALVRTAKIF